MLYDSASSSNEPSLYIFRVSNVLCSAPLIPFFVASNEYSTAWHWQSSRLVRVQSQTPVLTLGTATGYLRSALGCGGGGATGGGSPERYLWPKQKQGDRKGRVRLISWRRKPREERRDEFYARQHGRLAADSEADWQ